MEKKISNFISEIDELTNKPDKYLSLQEDEAKKLKLLTRNLYNFTKEKENHKTKNADILQKLIIQNLDEEQIWQQIELQNNSICNGLVSDIAHLLAKKDLLNFPLKEKKKKQILSNDSSSKPDKVTVNRNKAVIKKTNVTRANIKPSIVDDKFFKLSEMENFLEKIEKGEESDDAEVDYFEDDSCDDDNEIQLHYNDFFDEPYEEVSFDKNNGSENENKQKKVSFLIKEDAGELDKAERNKENSETDDDNESLNFDSLSEDGNDNKEKKFDEVNEHDNIQEIDDNVDDDDEDEDEGDNDGNFEPNEVPDQPSTFEARQERLKTRIQNLEEDALKEKPWQLKGEITANSRPQNSLLEEYVEFDVATRPAPVLTETSTLKLEDVIIQRIKDKAWDDVVRKIKPVESEIEYKKKLVLEQEKSKLSLAQIYEQEYLKQLDDKNEDVVNKPEVEAPEHQEIRLMMNKLFSKLDALSNFHFTPKQVAAEVKIISNLPAISMEEVAPVATSDAALLAPEEVKSKPKGDLIGKSERTTTDKKRERRQKKLKQKIKYKQMEAKEKAKLEKSGSKDSQDQKVSQKFLQKITKSSNVIQLDKSEGGKYVKSSNAFFSKLQDEANSVVNKRSFGENKPKNGTKFNSKKLKTR